MKLENSLVTGFIKFIVAQVRRSKNDMADALANLGSNALYPYHMELNIMAYYSISNTVILTAETRDDSSWISPITNYLKNGTLHKERNAIVKIKSRVARYALINDVLYMR